MQIKIFQIKVEIDDKNLLLQCRSGPDAVPKNNWFELDLNVILKLQVYVKSIKGKLYSFPAFK